MNYIRLYWRPVGAGLVLLFALFAFYQWRASLVDLGRWEQKLSQLEQEKQELATAKEALEAEKKQLQHQIKEKQTEIALRDDVLKNLYGAIRTRDARIAQAVDRIAQINQVGKDETQRIRTLDADAAAAELQRELRARPDQH